MLPTFKAQEDWKGGANDWREAARFCAYVKTMPTQEHGMQYTLGW